MVVPPPRKLAFSWHPMYSMHMATAPPSFLDNAEVPEGVELYDFEDAPAHRKLIYEDAQKTLQKQFPRVHNGVRMELRDLHYADPEDYTIKQQKEALLSDKYLARRLRGTVELYDDKTGDLLDKKTTTLMRVPYLTERHTIIRDGNEWSSIAQARLLAGAYTRVQANGEPETQFNVRPGTGMPFRVHMDPESAIFRMSVHGSDLSLYSLMKDIGISDDELRTRWGDEVFEANAGKYDTRTLDKAYMKIVPAWNRKANPSRTREEKAALIRDAITRSQAATKVLKYTLPNLTDSTKSASWKAAWENNN